jgi:cytochrome c oxidase subunit IV
MDTTVERGGVDHSGQNQDSHHDGPHIAPMRMYVAIVSLLFLMTAITVGAAFIELGPLGTPVALAIAIFKASMVVLFFMHVRYNTPLMWVFAGAGFFWLLIMFSLTMQDYMTRGWETEAPVEFLDLL